MSKQMKRLTCAAVMILFALAVVRAASFRYQEQEKAFRAAAMAELQKLGLTRDAAKAKFPTPEIHKVSRACLLPGATGEIVIRGKFSPGSKFIFQNDNIEVVKENLTPVEYRATLKAAPGAGPQTANVNVISPSLIYAQSMDAVMIGGRYEWKMEAANGWRVIARPSRAGACPENAGRDTYEVAFFRGGEAAPFEKREATLHFSMWEKENYRFGISSTGADEMSAQQQSQALMQKISDPKVSAEERQKLLQQAMELAKVQQAQMQKMLDPAFQKAMQEKRLNFGCEQIGLVYPGGGSFTGRMRCAEKVGRQITLTGTVTPLK
jgi:hypothetical protein